MTLFFLSSQSFIKRAATRNLNTLHRLSILLLFLPLQAVSNPLSLHSPDSPPSLNSTEGYLLVNLDASGTAPSFEFTKLNTDGNTYLKSGQHIRLNSRYRYTLNLKDKPPGLYLTSLPEGLYQITTINAPYFDLPFRLNTKSRRIWRFHIAPQRTNYIGNLFINKERRSKTIEVYLRNRIATDMEIIQKSLQAILEQYPLRSGAGLQDAFFSQWKNSKENEL